MLVTLGIVLLCLICPTRSSHTVGVALDDAMPLTLLSLSASSFCFQSLLSLC